MISLIICTVRELGLETLNTTMEVQTFLLLNLHWNLGEKLYTYTVAWTRNDICALFVSCEDGLKYSRV